MRDMGLDLSRSWLVGDQDRDILAGASAGCRTVLVTKNGVKGAQQVRATAVVPEFAAAVTTIVTAGAGATIPASSVPMQVPSTVEAPANTAAAPSSNMDIAGLRRTITDLTDELRSDRLRRAEFTMLRMAAGLCQLLALLLALLGLLQLGNPDIFMRWMIGAALVQMFTMTLLLLDLKT